MRRKIVQRWAFVSNMCLSDMKYTENVKNQVQYWAHLLLIIYYEKVLAYYTVEFDLYFKFSTIIPSMHRQNYAKPASYRPNWLLPINKYSEQLPVSPRLGGEDRYYPDPQVINQTKIRVKPSKELSLNPSKTTSAPEDKHAKRIPSQHKIRNLWNKQLDHRGRRPKEDLRMDHWQPKWYVRRNQHWIQ